MFRFTLGSTAIMLVMIAAPAHAEGDSGFYVAGFIGGGFPGDAELSGIQQPVAGSPGTPGDPARIDVSYDSTTNYGIAIGYDLPLEFFGLFNPRMELEYSILDAGVDGGSFNGGTQTFGGDTTVEFFLINNYTDVIWKDDQTFIPFFGGGIGIGRVDSNVLYGAVANAPTFTVTGDDTGLAGTFAVGATYRTSDTWEIYGEARYYQIRDLDFERRFIGGGANLFNAKVSDDFDGTTLTAGLRYRF